MSDPVTDPVLYTHAITAIKAAMGAHTDVTYEQGVLRLSSFEAYHFTTPDHPARTVTVSLYDRHIATIRERVNGKWAVRLRDEGFPTKGTQHVLQAVLDAALGFKVKLEPATDSEFFPALYLNSGAPDHMGTRYVPKFKWLDMQED